MTARDPVADLRRIAYLMESANEATYRVRAFRAAAAAISELDGAELLQRAAEGTLRSVPGVGEATAGCVAESLRGEEPERLRRLRAATETTVGTELDSEAEAASAPDPAAVALRAALRGDCHLHSDWSDGGGAIEEMALAAVELGHEYMVLTDHSPSLAVARGLTADRLRQQLDYVARLNDALPDGFRLLTGIEVDILADGSLDQDPELLAQLDVVVGSVHSRLKDPAEVM
nr:PHP domain-containing protein [Micromonospora sp. DSM 115978]